MKAVSNKVKNDRGVIAITVLWILAILSIMSVGLGQQASLELSLLKYEIQKFKGKYQAWAGVMYSVDKIAQDEKDDQTKGFDTLYQCGISLGSNETPETVFKNIPIGEGRADIGFTADLDGNGMQFYPGLQDETSKININVLTPETYEVFAQLIMMSGFSEQLANTIALSALDWKDPDDDPSQIEMGAEDSYYSELDRPYHCKNRPFESLEELLLVRGVTPELLDKIKGFITIYSVQGNFSINFDTASVTVLRALARGIALRSQAGPSSADNVVNRILTYRRGVDGKDMTDDDRLLNPAELQFSQEENVVFFNMLTFRSVVADHFTVNVLAKPQESKRGVSLTAVVSRPETTILYWHKS